MIGGPELEAIAIARELPEFHHRIVYPARFAHAKPSIHDRVPDGCEFVPAEDIEAALLSEDCDLVHLRIPFDLTRQRHGADSAMGRNALTNRPIVFSVHSCVDVPKLPGIHYLFHTAEQAGRMAGRLREHRRTVCPSLVPLPETLGRVAHEGVRILWISRREDAKFHPRIAEVCEAVLDACPDAHFRFVGNPVTFDLPDHPRIEVLAKLLADPTPELREADLFWYFPHPQIDETWSRPISEAMGHGLPCVVPRYTASRGQIVDGGQGAVVDSPEACTKALIEMVRSADLRKSLGKSARARAQHLLERAKAAIRSVYTSEIESRGATATLHGP